MGSRFKTDFLFSESSLLSGLGSVFNVPGNYFDFNYSENGHIADTRAITADWFIVGNDVRDAIAMLDKEISSDVQATCQG